MDDKYLLKRVFDLLMKARWHGNPNLGDKKAYVTFLIKDYADVVIDLGKRIDELKEENVQETKA